VGGILVQGTPHPRLNRLAVNLLAQGWSPKVVLGHLQADDDSIQERQVAILDRENSVITIGDESGKGEGYAVLASSAIVEVMKRAFEDDPSADLDVRLVATLEAGNTATSAGFLRSAAIVVWGTLDYSLFDLRVDLHDNPVQELRRVYEDFKPTAEFYEARARNPRMTMNAREFAGILETRKQQKP
jgi:uncharacterized Ntn-hydrolase superfamily protein